MLAALVALVLLHAMLGALLFTPRRMVTMTGYVINLDTRVNRMDSFEAFEWPFRIERVDAVHGSRVDLVNDKRVSKTLLQDIQRQSKTGLRMTHAESTAGGIGCYMSHLRAWKKCLRSGAEGCFVLEDDAYPTTNRVPNLMAVVRSAPRGTGILLLGGTYLSFVSHKEDDRYFRVYRFQETHAYYITRDAIVKLMPFVLPMTQQIDWEISEHASKGRVQIYALRNKAVKQGLFTTDVQMPV